MVVADARAITPSFRLVLTTRYNSQSITKGPCRMVYSLHACWLLILAGLVLMLRAVLIFGSEKQYLTEISKRFKYFGYDIVLQWLTPSAQPGAVSPALARASQLLKRPGNSSHFYHYRVAALRLEAEIIELLRNLGSGKSKILSRMPRSAHRRFGQHFLKRLDQALGS